MAFENFEQAAEALAAANNGEGYDAAPSTPVQPVETQPSQPVEPEAPQGDQGQPTTPVESTPKIDLSQLDPQAQEYIQAREREMQADYTRKTQEAAATRQEAEQALQFIEALNTDPNFALQVHQTLSENLQSQGYSVAQADAIAAQQIQGDPEYEDDPYMAKIQELEQWKSQQELRIAEAEAAARIDGQIATIRSANPSFEDNDLRDIISMGYAFGGDLLRATDAYKQITQRSVEKYIGQKQAVPASLNQPTASGHSQVPPEGFKSLNDPKLEQAALRMLQESGAWD